MYSDMYVAVEGDVVLELLTGIAEPIGSKFSSTASRTKINPHIFNCHGDRLAYCNVM